MLLKSSDPTHPKDSYTIEIAPDPFEKTDGNRLLGINTVFTLNSIKKEIISKINQISVKVNATISDVLEMKELEGIWQNKVTFEVLFKYSVSSIVVPKMEEGISGTGAVKNSK